MDDFSGQIIYQWKYEHPNPFLVSFSIYYTLFSEKMGKFNPTFKNIIQIRVKKRLYYKRKRLKYRFSLVEIGYCMVYLSQECNR